MGGLFVKSQPKIKLYTETYKWVKGNVFYIGVYIRGGQYSTCIESQDPEYTVTQADINRSADKWPADFGLVAILHIGEKHAGRYGSIP